MRRETGSPKILVSGNWWFSRHASKLNYHASEELKYHRRVKNKQRAKVSGMCVIPNSSYSTKGLTENYRV